MVGSEILEDGVGRARWRVWGTSVTLLVTQADALEAATTILKEEIAVTDATCNRFSANSELSRLNRAAGTPTAVSTMLVDDLSMALAAAAITDGAVDPTVGGALIALGYDRDFDELESATPSPSPPMSTPAPGWQVVSLDPVARVVTTPAGTLLDLGSMAKARCADRAAERIAAETGSGTLVDLGGDLRVVGSPPPGGWQVAMVDDARAELISDPACVVSVIAGGLASSSTAVRTWHRGGRRLHHVVDPATGWPAEAVWRTVTVAAETCAMANAISTASVVWGEDALFRVPQLELRARFVRYGGEVIEVGDWPRIAVLSGSLIQ